MSLRSPNDEQKLSIEHHGGVLLSAGAGSGKTFVLIEHVLYLIDDLAEKELSLGLDEFKMKLKSFFSQIVLMTFTNKAAGEISIRLKERLISAIEHAGEEEQKKVYQCAYESIPSLQITTIHGFCLSLIQKGLFRSIPAEHSILSKIESNRRVEALSEEWFDLKFREKVKEIDESFLKSESVITDAMINVFSNPDMRLMWSSSSTSSWAKNDERLVLEILKMLGISDLFYERVEFSLSEKPKKWEEFGGKLQDLLFNGDDVSVAKLLEVHQFFKNEKRLPVVKESNVSEEIYDFFQKVKKLKSFFKDYSDDFLVLKEDSEVLDRWIAHFQELFHFVEDNYFSMNGFTFGDLEYYTLKGLEEAEACQKIQSLYQYLIIDEFQDTSEIQFDIVKKVINSDYSKLFCVGDVKQAIYGFRGGELSVFQECSNNISTNLYLKNNYRSCKSIINFNNDFFDYLLPKGQGLEGEDSFSVEVVKQSIPPIERDEGEILCHEIQLAEIEGKKSLLTSEMDFIESKKILSILKNKASEEEVCILYRKLAPTKYLFPLLLENKLSFTCQLKISPKEDPLLLLLSLSLLNLKNEKGDYEVMISSLLSLISPIDVDYFKSCLKDFREGIELIGLWESFKRLIYSLGFSVSGHENNLGLIETLCRLFNDDWKVIHPKMTALEERYSIEFQTGENASKIKIMTVHASKGLEFEHVILGGIHTNGVSMGMRDTFGKMPFSMKWKKDPSEKKSYKTINFIFENLLSKQKEFSEGKRLFYVAGTRAQRKLSWVDINYNEKPQIYGSDSWIAGLRLWKAEEENYEKLIKTNPSTENLETVLDEVKSYTTQTPLFHLDNLGLAPRQRSLGNDLAQVPELSVTKMTLLSKCSRKFYFRHILGFSDEDMELIETKRSVTNNVEAFEKGGGSSSAERGTFIHEAISFAISRNWVKPNDIEKEKDHQAIDWALEKLAPYKDNHLFDSERPMKFPFFGFMVSGTPDLVLYPEAEEDSCQVWDFKTGRIDESREVGYWFQLMTYAFALLQESKYTKAKLVLCYVDKEELRERTYSFSELKAKLYEEWKKTSDYSHVDTKYCPTCIYGNICHIPQ